MDALVSQGASLLIKRGQTLVDCLFICADSITLLLLIGYWLDSPNGWLVRFQSLLEDAVGLRNPFVFPLRHRESKSDDKIFTEADVGYFLAFKLLDALWSLSRLEVTMAKLANFVRPP